MTLPRALNIGMHMLEGHGLTERSTRGDKKRAWEEGGRNGAIVHRVQWKEETILDSRNWEDAYLLRSSGGLIYIPTVRYHRQG